MTILLLSAGPTLVMSAVTLALAAIAVGRRSRVLSAAALISTVGTLPAAALGYSLAMAQAFSAVAEADPSTKATLLAAGISESMRGVALSSLAALLAGAVALGGLVFCYSRPVLTSGQEAT